MRKTRTIFYYLLVFTLLTAFGISCKDEVPIKEIQLNKKELLLSIGVTGTLKADLIPYSASAKMIWSSSDNSVATVESNSNNAAAISEAVVTAKNPGTAIITVATKNGEHSAICTVTVINPEPELIAVEGGTFTMGCTDGEDYENEFPAHQVTLRSFKIAKYTVTQQQWEAVMGTKPSHFKGADLPVEMVSWHDAQEFITKLNSVTGKNYRLPTEAEWEYAARGGNKSNGYKYSGSNDIDAVAWYKRNSRTTTHDVGTKAPNELGIYDMSGNVFEWCSDWFGNYTEAPRTNPPGADSGTTRVTRGGDFVNFDAYSCRVSFRAHIPPGSAGATGGFRLVHP
jgi:formylglycine-generating enzyme required for sulfatase activity